MHVRGIAHNDMHGGNIYVDEDDGSVLDLGIAKVDKLAALMEAIGGVVVKTISSLTLWAWTYEGSGNELLVC